jgi:glutamine synthetase adenylyltransferase
MGKCGARELNYISDVDVIWVHDVAADVPDVVHEQAATLAGELARTTCRVIMSPGPEPALWEVDSNLRPEGKDGALSRTVDSHVTYLNRWAHDWEFQALLKARAIAGDEELGRAYEDAVRPLVWSSSQRPGFVEGVQRMRARVTANIAPEQVAWQLKLGPGGLRDVEFTVQLLQLVHGRVEPRLQVRGTLESLHELGETAYISRVDADTFSTDYRFLRAMEHRIQLVRMRRTHLVPESEAEQRVLARGMATGTDLSQYGAERLIKKWRSVKASVRGLHQKLFFRPLLATAARFDVGQEAAQGVSSTSTLVNPLENYKRQRRAFRSSRLRLGHCPVPPRLLAITPLLQASTAPHTRTALAPQTPTPPRLSTKNDPAPLVTAIAVTAAGPARSTQHAARQDPRRSYLECSSPVYSTPLVECPHRHRRRRRRVHNTSKGRFKPPRH